MTKRMLIDATHAEETRVVVLNGNRLEEFDFETSTKKQLKGNIYLAKVTRVEPSLQAAFVEFGGNRHGFLAFSEIHPDYYQIPVADRVALLREHEEALAEEAEEEEAEAEAQASRNDRATAERETDDEEHGDADDEGAETSQATESDGEDEPEAAVADADGAEAAGDETTEDGDAEAPAEPASGGISEVAVPQSLEEIGGGDEDELPHPERRRARPRRQRYKIQEVIKRRQILLVQVVKEERGNKGAALTTYLSLAGRYCVLMPNTAKGGGVSRKITSPGDRKRLKTLLTGLEIADGMAVILRTAALERSKAELKRDFDFLMRSWDQVRELTLNSIAPTLVYEEANLIKRSIRDLYTKDIDEVQVEGDEGYKTAKEFMRMLMPSHAKKVQPYRGGEIPLFHRYQVEAQLDAMHSPQVQLKSGGYIVINPTEALVSIDVNSGRSTRERNIEETALKTNIEAADEIARQLKLRDLAGLVVIDFIDMAEHRNQHSVERRLKEAMRNDRARIQIGRISAFGLLELSRQRLRPSLLEASTHICPHCEGTGLVRSTESAALHVLRAIEEEGIRHRSSELRIAVAVEVALYILNQKRAMLHAIERRYGFRVFVSGDDSLIPPAYHLDRIEGKPTVEAPAEADAPAAAREEEAPEAEEQDGDGEERGGRRKRRRRGRGRGRKDEDTAQEAPDQASDITPDITPDTAPETVEASGDDSESEAEPAEADADGDTQDKGEEKPKRRRRGRRGGRRRGRKRAEADSESSTDAADESADETVEASENAADSDEPKKAAAKPRRRSRKAKSTGTESDDETAPEAPVEIVVNESESPEAVEPRPEPEPEPEPVAAGSNGADTAGKSGEHGSSEEEPVPEHAEIPAAAEAEQNDKPSGPRRRGWWNRFGG